MLTKDGAWFYTTDNMRFYAKGEGKKIVNNPFYKISENAFNEIQKEAGLILTKFDLNDPFKVPASEDIFATTTGGLHLSHATTHGDLGEGIDNVMEGMMELMYKESDDISLEYTSLTFNPQSILFSVGSADMVEKDEKVKRIVPRDTLLTSDFIGTLYCIFPMSNGGACGAILKNVLSTGGLDIQTSKNERGTNSVTLKPHRSIKAQNTVPIEYFFIDPPEVDELTVTSVAGSITGTTQISVSGYKPAVGESYKYKTQTGTAPEVEYGDLCGMDWTKTTFPSTVTANNGDEITVVSVDVDGYAVAAGSTTVTAKE